MVSAIVLFQSVQHENTYRNPQAKYCYGESPPELLPIWLFSNCLPASQLRIMKEISCRSSQGSRWAKMNNNNLNAQSERLKRDFTLHMCVESFFTSSVTNISSKSPPISFFCFCLLRLGHIWVTWLILSLGGIPERVIVLLLHAKSTHENTESTSDDLTAPLTPRVCVSSDLCTTCMWTTMC